MKKVFKVLLYIILIILALVIGLVIAINTPWGKEQIRKFAVDFLEKKLDTKVQIGQIDFSIPTEVNLKKVLVLDKVQDTILWVNGLDVNIDMLKLVSGRISVNKLHLDGADINLYRTPTDTNFNYQFIVDSFVGKPNAVAQETIDTAQASPIYLDAGTITISNTRFRFNDTIGGTLFGLKLRTLEIRPRDIDLNKMRFELESFTADTINSYFYALPSSIPPSTDTTEASNVVLIIDKLKLNNANFAMKDTTSGLNFSIVAKELSGVLPWFSLQEKKIEIDNFILDQTKTSLSFAKVAPQKADDKAEAKPEDTTGWRVLLNQAQLKDIAFDFDDNSKPKLKDGIDYSHLSIYNFYLTASDVLYSVDTISGIIKNLTTQEKSGLNIQTFRTVFTYSSKGAILDELYLKTPNTLLQDKMAISYKSLDDMSKNMGKMKLDIALKQSVLGFKDLFIFLPESQKKQLRDYRNQTVALSLLAKGPLERLEINKLFLKGLTRTVVDAKGILYGLPDAAKLRYDLDIKTLASSYKDIKSFVPASVQQQINIPATFDIAGKIKGTMTDYHPDLKIKTSDGNVDIAGSINMARTGKEAYNLVLKTTGFNLGKILKMEDQLGRVTMNGKVQGVGFDPKTMNATLDANISQAFFNGYDYQHVTANGFMKGQKGEISLKSRDENAFMTMNAFLDMSKKYPAITSTLNVEILNLKALNFTDEDVTFTGDVIMDLPSVNLDYPEGYINVNNPFLTINGTTYLLDSVYAQSSPVDSIQNINLNIGNIIQAKLSGHVPISKMGDVILAHVNKFYQINDAKYLKPLAYDMNLVGTISYNKLMRQIVPDLRPFDTIRFNALADPRSLNVGLSAAKIRYADMTFDTLGLSAIEQDSSLAYVLSLNKFSKGGIQFFNSSLFGDVKDNKISTFLNLADQEGKDQFFVGVYTELDNQGDINLKLARGLKLNYDDWTVDPNNRIEVGANSKGLFFNALSMSKGSESLAIQSIDSTFGSPFNVSINNFTLANLTKMVSKDTLLADGLLNATAKVDLRGEFPTFEGNASIDSLKVMGAGLGTLTLNGKNEGADKYFAHVNLSGEGNDIDIDGNYYTKALNGNDLDFKANIKAFSLKSIEPLTSGNLKNSKGTLWGNLSINGTLSDLAVSGEMNTFDLETTLASFNTFLRMPKEKITFVAREGMTLNDFRVYDRNERKATIDGKILTKNFTDYVLGLRFSADRWEAMNSTQKDNETLYGRIIMSADLGIKGPMTAPAIDGQLTIHDSTNFNYAMLDNPELVSNEGIVEFYDSKAIDNMDSFEIKMDRAAYLLSKSSSLNVNIDIDKGAQFTVLIDPETGDKLSVKGKAFLNANLANDGSMALAGTYELEDGYYDLNIEFIKKKFKIQKGSVIQLAGDPLDAEVNITAVYEANLSPYDLVQSQTQNDANMGYYRQKIPFEVLLKMSGNIMKPTISFDIVVPTGGLNTAVDEVQSFVENKLSELRNNPSDMNKQVVAVLALNRFIAEDPFSSSGSGLGIENAVRQSASRFLSAQLNRMAGNLISGLDVNLDLNSTEDYSTGNKINRTDLSISASKRLFNDRLKVTVGNDFALEGQAATQNASYIPGNISVDYNISQDGRYVLRGYRKTELQNIVSGYLVETGLSFRLALEYNKFRRLLMGDDKYFEYMRKKRAAENKEKQKDDNKDSVRSAAGLLLDQIRNRKNVALGEQKLYQ